MRFEYRIVRKWGIQVKFRRDLTTYELFNPTVYRKLQNLFVEAYQAILKFEHQCLIETREKFTPKMFDELVAEQNRQTIPKEYLHLLMGLKESRALTVKNLKQIQAANRRREIWVS